MLQATATSLEKAKKQYCEAIEIFETYFRVKRNVIYERARFSSRNQLEGEPVEQYVLSLRSLARNCEYGTLQEELMHLSLLRETPLPWGEVGIRWRFDA